MAGIHEQKDDARDDCSRGQDIRREKTFVRWFDGRHGCRGDTRNGEENMNGYWHSVFFIKNFLHHITLNLGVNQKAGSDPAFH